MTDDDKTMEVVLAGESPTRGRSEPRGKARVLVRGDAVGRYMVLEELGRGGMGIVYQAYDPELDRRVALKVLRGDGPFGESLGRGQLIREAQAQAKLSHPNVIPIYDVGEFDGEVFMAMELVTGTSLPRWFETKPGWRRVLEVFIAAGRGLAAARTAGLVHRDFKPANVLLGDDGRVRVLDFGLARWQPELSVPSRRALLSEGPQWPSALDSQEVIDGVTVGTPAFMSPEEHHGQPADAKSDQFAFCVSLYEGLYGKRPYAAAKLDALARAKAGPAPDPLAGSEVPAWLHRHIVKGLSTRPEDRFSSMPELLGAIAHDPWVAWKRRGTFGAMAAAAALGTLAVGSLSDDGPSLCEGGTEVIGEVWGEDPRRRLEVAFSSTDVPYAASTVDAVGAVLDDRAKGWAKMHREACEATHMHGAQSGHLLDLRMACLERRRLELATLVAVLSDPDSKTVEFAVTAAHTLPSVAACADTNTLSEPVPPPADPGIAKQISELRAEVPRAMLLYETGQTAAGLQLAGTLVEKARELSFQPATAEASLALGTLQEREGDVRAARESLLAAAVAAKAGKHGRAEAQAWITLVGTVGHKNANFDEARRWAAVAGGAVDAIGGDDELRATLLENAASVEFATNDAETALPMLKQAIEMRRKTLGPDHPSLADAYRSLGFTAIVRGDHEEGLEHNQEALRINRAAYGSEHPKVASAERQVGFSLNKLTRHQEAIEHYEAALALRKAAYGPDHVEVAKTLGDIGASYAALDAGERALRYHEQAIEILEKQSASGPLGEAYRRMGTALEGLGRHGEARAAFLRALEIRRELYGPSHPFVSMVEFQLASLAELVADWDTAAGHYEAVIAAIDAAGEDARDGGLGPTLTNLGRVRLEQGEVRKAIHALERAVRVAPDEAETEFWLAQALWREAKTRPRARELAEKARDGIEDADSELRGKIDAWLAER